MSLDAALHDLLDRPALERARRLQSETGARLDRIAAKLGLISDAELAAAYAGHLGSSVLAAGDYPDQPLAPELRPAFLRHARVLPVADAPEP